MLLKLATAVLGLIAATLGPESLRTPPATPPAYTETRPQPGPPDGYVSHTETILIDMPRPEFLRWVNNPDLELSDVVQGGEGGPQVVGTEILTGDWDPSTDRTGDRRRVRFADGHYLAEEVLADTPDAFRYMIWGFTEPRQRHAIDHAVAAFVYTDKGPCTRVTWTYSFQPIVAPLRPVVAKFVADTMPRLMQATLAGMKEGAEAA